MHMQCTCIWTQRILCYIPRHVSEAPSSNTVPVAQKFCPSHLPSPLVRHWLHLLAQAAKVHVNLHVYTFLYMWNF